MKWVRKTSSKLSIWVNKLKREQLTMVQELMIKVERIYNKLKREPLTGVILPMIRERKMSVKLNSGDNMPNSELKHGDNMLMNKERRT